MKITSDTCDSLDFRFSVVTGEQADRIREVHLGAQRRVAGEFKFDPEYSVAKLGKREVVVTVLAGRSFGQRRFDYYSFHETRDRAKRFVFETISHVVRWENARINGGFNG